jgi:hypothetical protein
MDGFTRVQPEQSRGYGWSWAKWRCDTCGREGGGRNDGPFTWVQSCLNGHSPCAWCGQQLTLRKDGTPRVHTRCPERPDDAELLRLVAAEVRHDARLAVRGPMGITGRALLDKMTRGIEMS